MIAERKGDTTAAVPIAGNVKRSVFQEICETL